MQKLLKINPEEIHTSNNLFFTLGLIRNDLGDLSYLQSLHVNTFKDSNVGNEISAINGQISGRNIFILRLALSHLYNALEFFRKSKRLINDPDSNLQKYVSQLNSSDKKAWAFFQEISLCEDYAEVEKIEKLPKKFKDIIKLSIDSRNQFTYHYYGSAKWIGRGYEVAFKNHSEPRSQYAYVTELKSIKSDRSYYVDLAIQRYLESKIGIDSDIFTECLDNFLDFSGSLNRVISELLRRYHNDIKLKDKF